MSGPVASLQGLCIFPRDVIFDDTNKELTRVTEAWLVGQNAGAGPLAVHGSGLWIGLGLREQVQSFKVGFGTRDGAIPTDWVDPSGPGNVEKALKDAFGANTAQWKGYHLSLNDLVGHAPVDSTTLLPTWNALFFKVVTKFHPNRIRDFHVVPVVVALASGANDDTFADSHYLLGLTVFTRSKIAGDAAHSVEDFMVVTQAMRFDAPHPGLTIPGPTWQQPTQPPARRPRGKGKPAPVPTRRPKARAKKPVRPAPKPARAARKAPASRRRRRS